MSIAHPTNFLVERFALLTHKNKILKAINGAFWADISSFSRLILACGIMVRLIMGQYSYDGTAYNSDDRTDIRTTFTNKLNEYTFHIHTDILYNFITSETSDFGVFAGVGLGYVLYKYTITDGSSLNVGEQGYSQIDTARDFDIRFVAGLRVNLAKRHGIEAFIQLPMLKQKENFAVVAWDGSIVNGLKPHKLVGITLTNTPSSSLGIRYIFSF